VSESLPPPDGELAGILAKLRDEEAAPPEVRARARSRLMAAVGFVPMVPTHGRGALSSKAAIASLAFLLGGVTGAIAYAVFVPRPAPQIVYVDRPAPAPPEALAAPPSVPAPPAPPPTVVATSTPAASVPSAPPSRASQLSAERVMLDEARAAIAQGEPARALERLERHRRTFSSPILGEERDAMRVEALAKAGRHDEAVAAAAVFHKRWPESLFASAVDDAVR
jgi:hypothetical protein